VRFQPGQRRSRTTASAPAPAVRKRGRRKLVITPDGETHRPRPRVDGAVVKALARAHRWQRLLETGGCGSITELAAAEKIDRSYLCRVLRLTLLAPETVEAILDGRQAAELQLDDLFAGFPEAWAKQARVVSRMWWKFPSGGLRVG